MNKTFIFLIALFLAASLASAFWPFDAVTGNAIKTIPAKTTYCNDSDNGIDEEVAGHVDYKYKSRWTTYSDSASDECDASILIEHSCSGNKVKTSRIQCENGCSGGKCITSGGGVSTSACTDSDSGINASVAGFILGQSGTASFQEADECINIHSIRERGCSESNESIAMTLSCSNTGLCNTTSVSYAGRTVNAAFCSPLPKQCDDSDGRNYSQAGIVIMTDHAGKSKTERDRCVGNQLKEVYCNDATKEAVFETVNCSSVCQKGRCVEIPVGCSDSDDGRNAAAKGTVTTNLASASDFCRDSKTLVELGCWNNGKKWKSESRFARIMMANIPCKNGCVNGICIPSVSGGIAPGGERIDIPEGDITNDGNVNVDDLGIITSNLDRTDCAQSNNWCNGADITRDGNVDVQDLILVVSDYE